MSEELRVLMQTNTLLRDVPFRAFSASTKYSQQVLSIMHACNRFKPKGDQTRSISSRYTASSLGRRDVDMRRRYNDRPCPSSYQTDPRQFRRPSSLLNHRVALRRRQAVHVSDELLEASVEQLQNSRITKNMERGTL